MIRVLHIGLSNSFGGIESFIRNLERNIDRSEFSFDYVALCPEAVMIEELTKTGSNVHVLANRHNIVRYYHDLFDYMNQGYDIVHIHKNSATDPLPFLCARKIPGLRIISHSHNTAASCGRFSDAVNPIGRPIVKKASDVMLACSYSAGRWLYGDSLVASGCVQVIPNGIELKNYTFDLKKRDQIRKELNLKGKLVLGCIGRFTPQKNQIFILGILKDLIAQGYNPIVLFLGDGILRGDVESLFVSEGLHDNASFLGTVDNVSDYIQAMDVLLMPSLYEGFPIVAIEAQASNLPCVISDSITDEVALSPLVTQVDVCPGSESRWAEAILDAYSREIVRSNGIESGLRAYDIRNTASLLEEVYRRCVRK